MKLVKPAYFFFSFIFLFAISTYASGDQLFKFAYSEPWLSTLHYKKQNDLFRSELFGKNYFLAVDGPTNPLNELKETIRSFNSSQKVGLESLPSQCVYQARKYLIEKYLKLSFPSADCSKWLQFSEHFKNAKKLSVVFSTAYQNNPGSMFGHLFIKIGLGRETDFFDIGINYAAYVPPGSNGLEFIYYGITGGYIGRWSIQPYYEKLNEYIKAESRDLWEYELQLTEEQIQHFVRLIWEIEVSSINRYYFFDDNCAYRIMRVIEAVKPGIQISNHVIYSMPGEMIKNLFNQEGFVVDVKYKPSLKNKLNNSVEILTKEEKESSRKFISGIDQNVSHLSSFSLKFLNLYYEYQRQKKKGLLLKNESLNWSRVQIENSKRTDDKNVNIDQLRSNNQPELGHDSFGLLINTQYENNKLTNLRFKLQSAYHDLKNIDLGYNKNSQILFPSVEVSQNQTNSQFELARLTGIDIISLATSTWMDPVISWQARLYLDQFYSKSNPFNSTHALVGRVGGGIALDVGWESTFYSMLGVQSLSSTLTNVSSQMFVSNGWILPFRDSIKFGIQLNYYFGSERIANSLFPDHEFEQFLTYKFSRNIELRQSFVQTDFQSNHFFKTKSAFFVGPAFYY